MAGSPQQPGVVGDGHAMGGGGGRSRRAQRRETYMLIANTSPVARSAKVTLLFEDGSTVDRDVRAEPEQPLQRRGGGGVPGGGWPKIRGARGSRGGRRRQRSSSSGRCTGTRRAAGGRRHERACDEAAVMCWGAPVPLSPPLLGNPTARLDRPRAREHRDQRLLRVLDEDDLVAGLAVDDLVDELPHEQHAEAAGTQPGLLAKARRGVDVAGRVRCGGLA